MSASVAHTFLTREARQHHISIMPPNWSRTSWIDEEVTIMGPVLISAAPRERCCPCDPFIQYVDRYDIWLVHHRPREKAPDSVDVERLRMLVRELAQVLRVEVT